MSGPTACYCCFLLRVQNRTVSTGPLGRNCPPNSSYLREMLKRWKLKFLLWIMERWGFQPGCPMSWVGLCALKCRAWAGPAATITTNSSSWEWLKSTGKSSPLLLSILCFTFILAWMTFWEGAGTDLPKKLEKILSYGSAWNNDLQLVQPPNWKNQWCVSPLMQRSLLESESKPPLPPGFFGLDP